ncbi:MAG: rod-binding protein [Planctomycetes bacterium]|nr:rod-binding protein [Planctomycetota bacterium]
MKDAARISQLTLHPQSAPAKQRQEAQQVADQFETIFVQSLVSSLRKTSTVGEGGMFGSDPGADTYGDWFDQNLAEQISESGHVGIAGAIMRDLERDGAIDAEAGPRRGQQPALERAGDQAQAAKALSNQYAFAALRVAKGGCDVLL